jgi:hypothetical protein
MTAPDTDTQRGRPAVYARLAADAGHHHVDHRPPGWVRWAGWAIAAAIVVVIVFAAVQVHPW